MKICSEKATEIYRNMTGGAFKAGALASAYVVVKYIDSIVIMVTIDIQSKNA